mgnify:CR=1 FL=1
MAVPVLPARPVRPHDRGAHLLGGLALLVGEVGDDAVLALPRRGRGGVLTPAGPDDLDVQPRGVRVLGEPGEGLGHAPAPLDDGHALAEVGVEVEVERADHLGQVERDQCAVVVHGVQHAIGEACGRRVMQPDAIGVGDRRPADGADVLERGGAIIDYPNLRLYLRNPGARGGGASSSPSISEQR